MSIVQVEKKEKAIGMVTQIDEEIQSLPIKINCDHTDLPKVIICTQ